MAQEKEDSKALKVVGKKVYGDILIVDDDKDICEVVQGYLRSMGCFRNIINANDGVMAHLKLGLQRFCLILLDLNLPKRTGEDILTFIHEKKDFNLVEDVVIMSGTLNERKFGVVRRLGVNKFILKPFTKESFTSKIEEFIKEKKFL